MGASSSITSSGKPGPVEEQISKAAPIRENIELDFTIETPTDESATSVHAIEGRTDKDLEDGPARTEETKLEIIEEAMAEDDENGNEGDGIHHQVEDNSEVTCSDLVNVNVKQIQKLFSLFDEDNSGSISSLELGKLVRSLGIYASTL